MFVSKSVSTYCRRVFDHGQVLLALAATCFAGVAQSATTQMVEYFYAPLDYYFVTSRANEQALLDGIAGWKRTGSVFTVFSDPQQGAVPLQRFFFAEVARGASRGSHFYSLSASDVALLRNQNPQNATTRGLPFDEGIDSYAYLPTDSGGQKSCAIGQTPVYRVFRGAPIYQDDGNHRYSTDGSIHKSMTASGWVDEGIAFCSPQAQRFAPSAGSGVVFVARYRGDFGGALRRVNSERMFVPNPNVVDVGDFVWDYDAWSYKKVVSIDVATGGTFLNVVPVSPAAVFVGGFSGLKAAAANLPYCPANSAAKTRTKLNLCVGRRGALV